MARPMEISLPVMYFDRSGAKVQRRLGLHSARVLHLEADEAPLVVQADARSYSGQHWGVADYRAFDGRLYGRHREVGRHRPTGLAELLPDEVRDAPEAWFEVFEGSRWNLVYDHPFLPDFAKIGGAGGYIKDCEFDRDGQRLDIPEFVRAAERMRKDVERSLVIDGEVWVPSMGPLVVPLPKAGNIRDGLRLEHCHPNVLAGGEYAGTRCRVFSAFDIDLLLDVAGRYFSDLEIPYEAPRILEHAGWSIQETCDQALDDSLDRLAWWALWAVKTSPASSLSRPLISAVIRLRDRMVERWGADIVFNPHGHHEAAVRPPDVPVPSPADLLEPLDGFLAVAQDIFEEHETKAFRMMRDALVRRMERSHAPEALAELSV